MDKKIWWAIGAGTVGGFITFVILGWIRYTIQLLLAMYAPTGAYAVFAVSLGGIIVSFILGLLPFAFTGLVTIWQYRRLVQRGK